MIRVNIKPLSVNEAWQGKRFKTDKYIKYERDLLLLLPKMELPIGGYFKLDINFGVSNMSSDIDNPLKPFIDVLQKKYKFNDRNIVMLNVVKQKVKKGNEFIEFQIKWKINNLFTL